MKSYLTTFLLVAFCLLSLAFALQIPQKAVVISFPANTPSRIVEEMKNAILKAGGTITHEYKIIKAFAATAPTKALDTVRILAADYNPSIEEDQIFSVNTWTAFLHSVLSFLNWNESISTCSFLWNDYSSPNPFPPLCDWLILLWDIGSITYSSWLLWLFHYLNFKKRLMVYEARYALHVTYHQ